MLAEMLDGIEMTPDEVAALVARARDAGYWTTLAPGLSVGQPAPLPLDAVDEVRARGIAEHLRRERYFSTGSIFDGSALSALNRGVDAVHAAGWPAVFALVYDDFWTCARHPLIRRIVSGHLGAKYRQIPHVWVHVVRTGSRGWMPHFDGLRPRRLTVWIALTDATVDTGCIHIVPPDALPESFRTMDVDAAVPMHDVLRAMHATRALEVAAGGALGWEFDVFHWGGRAAAPLAERRSISLEFLAGEEPPRADETPLVEPENSLPAFEFRLGVIAAALRAYAAREASLRRFRALAPGLLA